MNYRLILTGLGLVTVAPATIHTNESDPAGAYHVHTQLRIQNENEPTMVTHASAINTHKHETDHQVAPNTIDQQRRPDPSLFYTALSTATAFVYAPTHPALALWACWVLAEELYRWDDWYNRK